MALRGAAHKALADRGSRLALYDLKESFESAREALPVDFLGAAAAIGDAACLESVAAAYARAMDSGRREWTTGGGSAWSTYSGPIATPRAGVAAHRCRQADHVTLEGGGRNPLALTVGEPPSKLTPLRNVTVPIHDDPDAPRAAEGPAPPGDHRRGARHPRPRRLRAAVDAQGRRADRVLPHRHLPALRRQARPGLPGLRGDVRQARERTRVARVRVQGSCRAA